MRTVLGILSAGLTAVCVLPYLRDISRGTTRPQRVSWLVFATLSAFAALSQWSQGASSGALLAAGSAVGFGAVAIASIRHGEGGSTGRDLMALGVGITGVVLSVAVDRPIVAIAAVIAAEIAAISLTARKAHANPESETISTWIIDAVAGAVAILAAPDLSVGVLVYPIHHFIVNLWVVFAIQSGRRARRSSGGVGRVIAAADGGG